MKLTALALTLLAAAACGSKAKTTDPKPTAVAWADMNDEQRHDYMKNTVLPQMKETFVAFDAEEFAEMDCKTCHGPGVDDKSFKMPNPDLMPLDFSPGAMEALDEDHQKVAKWMGETVLPQMANLLGEKPYDPATQQGFGCLGCHTMATAK